MNKIVLLSLLSVMVLISGCVYDYNNKNNIDFKTNHSGEIGITNIYDTTCGGVYDTIQNGTTDIEGKYTFMLENGEKGTIIVKDASTNKSVEGIDIVFLVSCNSLETSSSTPENRTFSNINFKFLENDDYYTDIGTGSFITIEGITSTEVTYFVISKNATVSDAESAVELAEEDPEIKEWILRFDDFSSSVYMREAKWKVHFEGLYDVCPEYIENPPGSEVGGCSGGMIDLFVDPKTGEVIYPEDDYINFFSQDDEEKGFYYGSLEQRKLNTPKYWIHIGEGTRSAKWFNPIERNDSYCDALRRVEEQIEDSISKYCDIDGDCIAKSYISSLSNGVKCFNKDAPGLADYDYLKQIYQDLECPMNLGGGQYSESYCDCVDNLCTPVLVP